MTLGSPVEGVTKRVTAARNDVVMTLPLNNSLENCDAVMVGLGRRYVVIRRDEPTELRSIVPRRERIRDLRPGDEVIHRGRRAVVRSVQVY